MRWTCAEDRKKLEAIFKQALDTTTVAASYDRLPPDSVQHLQQAGALVAAAQVNERNQASVAQLSHMVCQHAVHLVNMLWTTER